MIYDSNRDRATPGSRSSCPSCGGPVVAKCGRLVAWHWSHLSTDCDPWSEPESQWHLGWKDHFESLGAQTEVRMPPHRADIIDTNGRIIELQSSYLGSEDIAARELFYGPSLTWLYRCHWGDRLQFGRRGFWWKHGSKAMATHRRPVWWHVDDELWRVDVSAVPQREYVATIDGQRVYVEDGTRILGRVLMSKAAPLVAA